MPAPSPIRRGSTTAQTPVVTGLNGAGGALVGGALSGILAVAGAAEEGRCREPTSMVRRRSSEGPPLPADGHGFETSVSGVFRCITASSLEDTITAESALSARDTCSAMTAEACTCSPQ